MVASIPDRLGWLALVATFILAAFVMGYNVGMNADGCMVVRDNARAFQTDPTYWTQSMRTLVESCQKGE